MIAFDIETKLEKKIQVPYKLGYTVHEKLKIIDKPTCVDEFLTDILKKRYNFHSAIAHNFASFDSFFILTELKTRRVRLTMFVRGNSVIFLRCIFRDRTTYFRDSYLYFGKSLSAIYSQYNWSKRFISTLNKNFLTIYLIFDLIEVFNILIIILQRVFLSTNIFMYILNKF